MAGKIFSKTTLFFREKVGAANYEDGNSYCLSLSINGSHPIVESEQSGQFFMLRWGEIVELARARGIDSIEAPDAP